MGIEEALGIYSQAKIDGGANPNIVAMHRTTIRRFAETLPQAKQDNIGLVNRRDLENLLLSQAFNRN